MTSSLRSLTHSFARRAQDASYFTSYFPCSELCKMVDLEKVMPELNDKFRIDRGAHHQVIVSLTDTSSSTHFDDADSVLHVMKGAKRIALAPACLKLELAQANGLKSFSSYDPFTDANVDRRVWKFVDMWEGGSLFLPKNMWHHVLSAAGTMALSFNVEIMGGLVEGGRREGVRRTGLR